MNCRPVLGLLCLSACGTLARAQDENDAVERVLTGIDVVVRDDFAQLAGRKVGVITNHTGIDQRGKSVAHLLHESSKVQVVSLFSPEHGFAGLLDQPKISDGRDTVTGLKVFSLYGKTRSPTPESLAGIDTLVFDIQDIGARFYTYISTMGGAMRAAADHDVRFVVLDRPNPIGGVVVQGPVLDPGSESFVGFHPIAVRHGMTTGELALMFREELELDLELSVIQMEGWRREMAYDETGLLWVNPSPNMRCLTQAFLYPGIGLLETTNISVGRGTDTPFEVVGAPWIDPLELARELNGAELPGIRFVPIRYTPDASKYEGETCGGVNLIVTDRGVFDPLRTGLTLASTLHRLYQGLWDTKSLNRLMSSKKTFDGILSGNSVEVLQAAYHSELAAFNRRRSKYLLYEGSTQQ